MNQSRELTKFYQDLQHWIDQGCPDSTVFVKELSMCLQTQWCVANGLRAFAWEVIKEDLREQFCDAGLDMILPFNVDEENSYNIEHAQRDHFKNEKRLAWIKEHANVPVT